MGTRIGWSSLIELTTLSPGMSAAVTTTTFDQSKPGSRSSASNRACASVERIVAPNQAPGKTRSSAYFAAPVSLSGPSRRSGATPRARPGAIVPGRMTTAPGGSVRVVRSGTGHPPWRLTLSPGAPPQSGRCSTATRRAVGRSAMRPEAAGPVIHTSRDQTRRDRTTRCWAAPPSGPGHPRIPCHSPGPAAIVRWPWRFLPGLHSSRNGRDDRQRRAPADRPRRGQCDPDHAGRRARVAPAAPGGSVPGRPVRPVRRCPAPVRCAPVVWASRRRSRRARGSPAARTH